MEASNKPQGVTYESCTVYRRPWSSMSTYIDCSTAQKDLSSSKHVRWGTRRCRESLNMWLSLSFLGAWGILLSNNVQKGSMPTITSTPKLSHKEMILCCSGVRRQLASSWTSLFGDHDSAPMNSKTTSLIPSPKAVQHYESSTIMEPHQDICITRKKNRCMSKWGVKQAEWDGKYVTSWMVPGVPRP